MALNGFIDAHEGWFVRGWAHDDERPGESLDVTLTLDDLWETTVRADEFRADLRALGMGSGRHGFSCRLPAAVLHPGSHRVVARINGTTFVLHGSPLPVAPGLPIEIVAGDIVNNCNLRCPFCITDYERIKGLRLMTEETLQKSVPLMSAVEDGGFWLSCMHEPTLHPRFADLVLTIPDRLRRKVSFTTNLCKRIAPEAIRSLAHSGIHSIRVSLDSLQPARFEVLRKGGRFATFIEQLRHLVACLRDSPRRPRLDFVTVVLRDNADEIEELVRVARADFAADRHEIRFMYYAPHLAEWGASHILGRDQWNELRARVLHAHPGHELAFGDPPDEVEQQFALGEGTRDYEHPEAVFGGPDTTTSYTPADPLRSGYPVPDKNFRLRMRWDGLMMAEELPEWEMRTNINDLADPADYFTRLRAAACTADTRALGTWSRLR